MRPTTAYPRPASCAPSQRRLPATRHAQTQLNPTSPVRNTASRPTGRLFAVHEPHPQRRDPPMTSFSQQPRATCPVLRRPPGELEHWTAHMVSMMQALQSGPRPTVYPGRIIWTTPDGAQLGFNRQQGQLRNVGVLVDIGLVQGMAEDLELLFVMTEDLLDATKDNMPVATGRRTDPDGQHHGYRMAGARESQTTRASRSLQTRSSPSGTTGRRRRPAIPAGYALSP